MKDKALIAKDKFTYGTEAFTYKYFSDAVRFYLQSFRIYNKLKMKNEAFMAFYQALIARSKEYPNFLNKNDPDFLRLEYLQELGDFATNFSEFEKGDEYYREKYIKQKYKYLCAKSFKFDHENDFEAKSKNLLELASFVEAHVYIFRSGRYQIEKVFMWRMMAEQSQIIILRSKRESIRVIAERYKRVANMCVPPQGSTSPFSEKIRAHQSNLYAEAFKFMAFNCLDKRGPSVTDLKEALDNMAQALDHAQKAKASFDKINKKGGFSNTDNIQYLSYWYNVFLIRVSVVDKEFDKAQKALESALSNACYFIDLEKEDQIFPNYYADFESLKNEGLIIYAFKAIVLGHDTVKSSKFLKQWIDLTKGTHFGSWYFNNVYIRYLVASILSLLPFLRENLQNCKQLMEKMDKLLKYEFVGGASRKLVVLVKNIVQLVDGNTIKVNDNVYGVLFNKVCDYFPIDSTSRGFETIESLRESINPFDYLPEYFSQCFKKPENLEEFSQERIEELYQTLMDGLRYYLIIIVEFHYKRYLSFKQQRVAWLQTLPDNFDINFEEMKIDRLIFSLGEVCKAFGEKRFQKFEYRFHDVEGLCSMYSQIVAPDIETVAEIFHIIVKEIGSSPI